MEKAILKTLIYGDLFEYPLKVWEIHKWLIGKKTSLRQIEKILKSKSLVARVKSQGGYYFLKRRGDLASKRLKKEKISNEYLKTANRVSFFLKFIPWIKLVGISGSLSMMNAGSRDDIDFFIITARRRIWLSRFLIIGILNFLNIRRKVTDSKKSAKGKVCVNLLLDEDSLACSDKNIYIAHEVLQMTPIIEKDGIYHKFLEENIWAINLFPNWITSFQNDSRFKIKDLRISHKSEIINHQSIFDYMEQFAKWVQIAYMKKPKGAEKITESALYFHPEDKGKLIMSAYNKKILSLRTK